MCILHLHGRPLRDAIAILAAFSNAFNKHMLAYEFHLCSLSFVSTLCITYTLLFILCQLFYLSFWIFFRQSGESEHQAEQSARAWNTDLSAKCNVQSAASLHISS
jgi:hypothetical protein